MKQKGFLLAAGFSLAMVFTFSCSGDDGTNGTNGIDGAQGESGADGVGCTVSSVAQGTQVTCGENVVIIPNGSDGANGNSCRANQDEDGIITITCGSNTVGIAFCGEENKFYNPTNQSCYNDKVYYFFTDSRDDKKYVYVEIGEQTWMAENLNYAVEGSVCYGDEDMTGEDNENCGIYGRLYNWETAKNVCPTGWHLPTNEEWSELLRFVDGNDGTSSPYYSTTAGGDLKATRGWNSDGNGEDIYSFAALPSGRGYSTGEFTIVGNAGFWWSTSESSNISNAYSWYMSYSNETVDYGSYNKSSLFSVRCLRN